MQSLSGSVVSQGKHNMDEADARLVGLDNLLSKLAFCLQLLEAAFYGAQLISQGGSVFRLADRDFRSQFFALLPELNLLRIAGRRETGFGVLERSTRAFNQPLLRQHAR